MSLTLEQVTAGYGTRVILREVTCAACPGSVTVLLGPNGAGKTTLLRVLVGALRPRSGVVLLDGTPLFRVAARERACRVALIPQSTIPEISYSVERVVRLGRLSRHEPASVGATRAREAMERVGLLDRASEPMGLLSAGQQQRVLLARALAQLDVPGDGRAGEGRWLLADEPAASMDPRHALACMDVLAKLAATGVGVVVVLHDFAMASRIADRVILLAADGTIAAEGSCGEVLCPGRLGPVFGVEFTTVGGGADGRAFPIPTRA